uniref:Na+/H+ antiporter NhaC-like C-terminal domain-containing protein n=1 Tax=Peronospora matthiolae TaxID=2874970 RepID=A0AAV1UJW8_9STRA
MCLLELLLVEAALVMYSCNASSLHNSSVFLQTPTVVLQQVDFKASIELLELKNGSVYPKQLWYCIEDEDGTVLTNGTIQTLEGDGNYQSRLSINIKHLQLKSYGKHKLTTTVWEKEKHKVEAEPMVTKAPQSKDTDANVVLPLTVDMLLFRVVHTTSVTVSPGWVSLLPPLVTLIMSAVLGQVAVSLLAGIWCGAIIVSDGNPFTSFLRTFDQYWTNAFTVNDHAGVLLFTIILGGTIGVVQKGGGGHGLALIAKKFMTSSLRMQLSTWLLCLVIFFDDYSCILIVGSSLRQVLSQTGVSREKFAAIIHTVGVCLPSMSPVSAWIGVEIGYVAAQLRNLKLDWNPFVTCLSCLHYRFFPILFIAFIFITIICEKDFGPMVQFEKDAAASPINHGSATPVFPGPMDSPKPELAPLEPDTTKPLRWQNAVVPFLSIVALAFVGMIFDGYNVLYMQDPNRSFGILDALSHCNSVASLLRASAAGWVIAVALLLMQRIITLNEATKAWMEGVKDILDPTLILTLAWALGAVIGEVSTAPYIASVVGDSVPKQLLPAIACLLCYVVSFAVGSAFGTMAIMFPIIAPLSWSISGGDTENLRQCFGSILGGSVFGNTCSPIADTSILASLSAHVPLESHIRSILPYALLVAVVSVAGGYLPIGLKVCSTFTAFGICLAVLLLVVFFFGTRVNTRYHSLSSCSPMSMSPPSRYNGEGQPLLLA